MPPLSPRRDPVASPRDSMAPLVSFPCDLTAVPVSPAWNPMAPSVSFLWDPAALSVSLFPDSMAPPVSFRRDPYFPRYPTAPVVSPPRDPTVFPLSPQRDPAVPLVFLLRGLVAPHVFPFCVLAMPAAAPAPALVLQAIEHLSFRLNRLHLASGQSSHCQHRCCQSYQARQFSGPLAVLLSSTSLPRRVPTGPSSRFLLPEPFSALSPRSGARARDVPSSYHALSPPPPASPLSSGSVSYLRRPATGLSPALSSPQPSFLPTPAMPLHSGSVSHLLRRTVPCGGRS